MNYIKRFLIGSSFPVFIYFFLKVQTIPNSIKNYTYEQYTIIAPFYLGLMNVMAGFLNKRYRYLLIGVISPTIVFLYAYMNKSYNFTNKEWRNYFVRIYMTHLIIFNVIVKNLSQMV